MSWQEVLNAKKEGRHEIILFGSEITDRINKSGLDLTLFEITTLNYLDIHETCLNILPDAIQKLINLQTLVLHSNKLTDIPKCLFKLTKLKILDFSRNALVTIPDEISNLVQLTTLNVSYNNLESFPTLSNNVKLTVLNLSNNRLKTFPDVCHSNLNSLSELFLSSNEIEAIPHSISVLTSLKVFYINSNKLSVIPGELYDCSKLKELNLKDNLLVDKRLSKLIIQCHSKQVLDYIKQHCARSTSSNINKNSKKGKKTQNRLDSTDCIEKEENEYMYKISVRHFTDDSLKITVIDDVKDVRPHLVACLVLDIKFDDNNFKKFIQIQTKLHDTLCDKRNVATIATHDVKKMGSGNLVYTAMAPGELTIKPLNRTRAMSGAQLFSKLQAEADQVRKEKKRNTYSGIHKYLYLLEGKSKYPCLVSSDNEVISFPPITNSDTTKMGLETTALLIEVTSATSQSICKKIADTLIKEMLQLFGNSLVIQQVRNVDVDGNLKSVYPSRSDLIYENDKQILVDRENK